MRTTINLDPELLEEARHASGLTGRDAVVRAALLALIERESGRRLASLGGTEPQLVIPPRRRPARG
jgi:Arc/MetJ family transcription regulator